MRPLLLLTAIALLTTTSALACPLGPNEEALSLSRVMKNFDKFSRLADSSVRKGLEDKTSVTDVELEQVVSNLEVVASCAVAVLTSESFDLLPAKAKRLTGQEQKDLIAKYLDYMSRFKAETILYSEEFARLRSFEMSERDFANANLRKQSFSELVDEAHTHF